MRRTGRVEPRRVDDMADRILLDALGLGIEQTLLPLLRERPDFPAFEAWVLETAGALDADKIERYNAWYDGLPMPEVTRRRLAAIDAMPPVLDADDLRHWDVHGYVVLPGAIGRDEAADLEARLWRVIDARPDQPASWYGPRTNGIMIQHFQHPAGTILRQVAHFPAGAGANATALHFIAALPASPHTVHPPWPQMLEFDMSDNALRTRLLKTPLEIEAGHVLLPEGPGLGIELDPAAVERYRVC